VFVSVSLSHSHSLSLSLSLSPLLSLRVCVFVSCSGVSILVGLDSLVDEVLELQSGVVLDLGPEIGSVFVIGGVGAVISDFPEGNELSDSMGPGATRPCRACDKPKGDFHKGIVSPLLTEIELRRRQAQLQAAPDAATT
jgi:hypothetical protein